MKPEIKFYTANLREKGFFWGAYENWIIVTDLPIEEVKKRHSIMEFISINEAERELLDIYSKSRKTVYVF